MIKSVQKAVQILQILSDGYIEPMPLGKIAKKAGLNKSTCAHLLETLCDSGMAERLPNHGGYMLGMMSYYITRHNRYHQELIEICAPIMRWLFQKTGHSIVLVMLRNRKKVIIHKIKGLNSFPSSYGNFYFENLYRFSTSHAMIAAMNEVARAEFFEENGYPTESEWPKLYEEGGVQAACDEINRRTYEIFRCPYLGADAAPNENVVGMAIAIKKGRKVVAGLGVSFPNEHMIGGPTMKNGEPWYLSNKEETFIAKHLSIANKEIIRRMEY